MYQGFSIADVVPCYEDNDILVYASFDIDPETVNDNTIQLFDKTRRINAEVDLTVTNKKITVLIKEDIIPNAEYILRVSGLKNIIGEELTSGVRRKIVFKSGVKEIPHILTPSDYEEVSDLNVSLTIIKEDVEVEDLDNKMFFIQIAKDVAFIDVVMETSTDKKQTNLSELIAGQYYIRARVESIIDEKKEVGKWCDTVTFISMVYEIDEPGTTPPDITEPEYIEYTEIVGSPVNGETPETILIEFNGEIDIETLNKIIVIRRDI